MRKLAQGVLSVSIVNTMLPIQSAEATQTLFQLLNDPTNYYDHIRRYSTAVVLASVYGQRAANSSSDKVRIIYDVMERFTGIMESGAAPPIDQFPVLKYLPDSLAGWKKEARAIRKKQKQLYFTLWSETKKHLESGRPTGCFMEKMIQDAEKLDVNDEWMSYIGGLFVRFHSFTTEI